MGSDLRNQAISGVKWTTISTVLITMVAILKISILTRFLEKSDFGLIAIVSFILSFTKLFIDMGLTSAILHKQNISKNDYASLYWLNFGFSFLLYLVVVLITPLISNFYSEKELLILLPLMGLSLLFSALGRQFKTIEQKQLHFKFISIVEISASILSLISAIILAIKGFGVYTLVYSALLLYLFSNIIFFINGLRVHGLKLHYSFIETKPFLKIGLYNTGGQVINYFNKELDILIIGKIFGAEVLGGYSLAKELVNRPKQVLNPIITKVASPVLARFQFDIKVLKRNYLKLVNIVSTINVPVYGLIILLASPLVKILYGSEYESIVPLVRILSVYMLLIAVRNPMGSLIIATGKTNIEFYWFLFTFPVVPFAIILASGNGIEWIAISMVLAMMFLFIPFLWFVINKMIPISLTEYMRAHIPDFKYIIRNFQT